MSRARWTDAVRYVHARVAVRDLLSWLIQELTFSRVTADLVDDVGPVWQGSGSSKNGSGSGSSGGAVSLVELEPFSKIFGKTVSPLY